MSWFILRQQPNSKWLNIPEKEKGAVKMLLTDQVVKNKPFASRSDSQVKVPLPKTPSSFHFQETLELLHFTHATKATYFPPV